jgi:DNA-binding ferritin-like protein
LNPKREQLIRRLTMLAASTQPYHMELLGLVTENGRDVVLEMISDLSGTSGDARIEDRLKKMANTLERVKNNPDWDMLRRKAQIATKRTAVAAKDTTIKTAKATAWRTKEAGLAARVAALEQCVSSLSVPDSSSPTLRSARSALAAHRQTPKYNPTRRNPDDAKHALGDMMHDLLGLLIAIKMSAWLHHWNVKGANFYGQHLMLERLYKDIDENIDKLGEKIASYLGEVDVGIMDDVGTRFLAKKIDLLSLTEEAKATSDTIRETFNAELRQGTSSLPRKLQAGLDDYLMALNNDLDTYVYLLRRSAM